VSYLGTGNKQRFYGKRVAQKSGKHAEGAGAGAESRMLARRRADDSQGEQWSLKARAG